MPSVYCWTVRRSASITCGSLSEVFKEVERVVQLTGRSLVRIPAPTGCLSKCPWARCWTPNCSWWTLHGADSTICVCMCASSVVKCFERPLDWKRYRNAHPFIVVYIMCIIESVMYSVVSIIRRPLLVSTPSINSLHIFNISIYCSLGIGWTIGLTEVSSCGTRGGNCVCMANVRPLKQTHIHTHTHTSILILRLINKHSGQRQQSLQSHKSSKINTCIHSTIHLYCLRWSQLWPPALVHPILGLNGMTYSPMNDECVRAHVCLSVCVPFMAGGRLQAEGCQRHKKNLYHSGVT